MKKKYLLLFILLFSFIIILNSEQVKSWGNDFIIWIENLGYWGFLLFIIIYNIATLLCIPGSILTIKGGCLYGLFLGTTIVLISALLGAIISFFLGRYFCQNWVHQKLEKYPMFQKLDRLVAQGGWKIVFLTRLSPIFPFNLLNYFFGITKISFIDYMIGSIGILPGTFMYVYIGSLTRDLTNFSLNNNPQNSQTQSLTLSMHIVGIIATFIMTFYSIKITQNKINKDILDED